MSFKTDAALERARMYQERHNAQMRAAMERAAQPKQTIPVYSTITPDQLQIAVRKGCAQALAEFGEIRPRAKSTETQPATLPPRIGPLNWTEALLLDVIKNEVLYMLRHATTNTPTITKEKE